ncbi:MAG: hypothetical protein IPK69_10545 [Phycisphaerales bacterium]|nr:MAG: hypothetical protein IPK69_10545 [Phycisphaerales bacterium]
MRGGDKEIATPTLRYPPDALFPPPPEPPSPSEHEHPPKIHTKIVNPDLHLVAMGIVELTLCMLALVVFSLKFWWLGVMMCLLVLAVIPIWVIGVPLLYRNRLERVRERRSLNQCLECGYDRKGLHTDEPCPECDARA